MIPGGRPFRCFKSIWLGWKNSHIHKNIKVHFWPPKSWNIALFSNSNEFGKNTISQNVIFGKLKKKKKGSVKWCNNRFQNHRMLELKQCQTQPSPDTLFVGEETKVLLSKKPTRKTTVSKGYIILGRGFKQNINEVCVKLGQHRTI